MRDARAYIAAQMPHEPRTKMLNDMLFAKIEVTIIADDRRFEIDDILLIFCQAYLASRRGCATPRCRRYGDSAYDIADYYCCW